MCVQSCMNSWCMVLKAKMSCFVTDQRLCFMFRGETVTIEEARSIPSFLSIDGHSKKFSNNIECKYATSTF